MKYYRATIRPYPSKTFPWLVEWYEGSTAFETIKQCKDYLIGRLGNVKFTIKDK